MLVAIVATTAITLLALGAYGSWTILAGPIRNLTGMEVERWPTLERIELCLLLNAPPRLTATAQLELSNVRDRHVPFLLNRELKLEGVLSQDGEELEWKTEGRLRSRYHREGHVVVVDLGRDPEPAGERVNLTVAYGGKGADGSGSRDWRGILMLAPDEFRMSEQTIFYPQIPADVSGPGKQRSPARVWVSVPDGFEVFLPGLPFDSEPEFMPPDTDLGANSLCFDLPQPGVLNVMAGKYVRHESDVGGLKLVSLMKEEHAPLGPEIVSYASRACSFYTERFGAIDGHVLGVVEIDCRGDNSYNWASQGLVVFDGPALDGGVPQAKLGHEVAHLWWGQAVRARGPGERFLTEGLAEYSAWRWLERVDGRDVAVSAVRDARTRYMEAAHRVGADPALQDVGFDTPGYNDLAYRKGALVVRYAEHALGRDVLDKRLASYVAGFAGGTPGLEDFGAAVAGSVEEAHSLLPWLFEEGHAHVEFEGIEIESVEAAGGGREATVRGTLHASECPASIPALVPVESTLRFAGPGGTVDRAALLSPTGARSFLEHVPDGPEAILLDPEATFPLAGPAVYAVAQARLVRSEPANGAVDVSFTLEEIVLEFDRELVVPKLRDVRGALYNGSKKAKASYPTVGAVRSSSDGRGLVLELTHPLRPGSDVVVDLTGVVADTYGVPVEASLTFRAAESDDETRPFVVSTVPGAGAGPVELGLGELRITFSEPMAPGRGYKTTTVRENERQGWSFPSGQLGDSRWEDGRKVLVYELKSALEPGTKYTLPLRGTFKDLSGNALVDYDFRFETR
jgi:hypothetical protein